MTLFSDPVFLSGLAGGSAVGKGIMQFASYQNDMAALKIQNLESKLQYQQKTLNNLDMVKSAIGKSVVAQASSGNALSSPSFGAYTRGLIKAGGNQQKNLDLEKSITDYNYSVEKRNSRNKLYSSFLNDFSSFGADEYSLNKSKPGR